MDTLGFLFMTALGVACWILGAQRKLSPAWVKLGVIPACMVLVIYFVIAWFRAQPELWSGQAETGWPIVTLIALGVYSAIAERKPKPGTNGDVRSA